jgi:imidazole glycerol-phosphate synthase subunit HisF
MLNVRVIPTLLLKEYGLVKGTKFTGHKYVGDPVNAVKIFNDKEVDELVFLDVGATNNSRQPNFTLLEDIASQAFMPLAYGGGLNNLSDIERIFKIGFEKVVINTAFVENEHLVYEASKKAGSQSIVVSIDVRKSLLGKYSVCTRSGTNNMKLDPVDLARRACELGAGEIIICSVEREGTGKGYDNELVRRVSESVDVPVVAMGGASSLNHFKEAVQHGASAVAAGDMFTFHGKHKAVLITYPEYETLERLFKSI